MCRNEFGWNYCYFVLCIHLGININPCYRCGVGFLHLDIRSVHSRAKTQAEMCLFRFSRILVERTLCLHNFCHDPQAQSRWYYESVAFPIYLFSILVFMPEKKKRRKVSRSVTYTFTAQARSIWHSLYHQERAPPPLGKCRVSLLPRFSNNTGTFLYNVHQVLWRFSR